MRTKLIITALCVVCYCSMNSFAASFSCEQMSNALERTICSDSRLSKADEEMSKYYDKLKESLDTKQSQALLHEQRAWLKQRVEKCLVSDTTCLQTLYGDRIHQLRVRYENLVPFVIDDPGSLQGLRGTCSFHDLTIPTNLFIYAAGAYSGRKLNIQIDQSGHQATQFDVIVNSSEKPVALLLGAYEPSIWNIGWTKGTKIFAVVASGYHRQAVAGLPKDTPILISTHNNKGPCGYTYVCEKKLTEINPLSQKIFGRPVDMVYFASAGKIVIGKPIAKEEPLFTSQDVTPDSFVDKKKPLAGPAGIQDAVAKGFLRPATHEDAEAWATRKSKLMPKDVLPPVSGGNSRRTLLGPHGYNVFVIQKKFTLPSGLYGGNSATFYLPEGVPYPDGELGHSELYDFNTMTCRGPGCNAHRSGAHNPSL